MSEPEMPGGAVDLDQTDWRSPVSDRVAAPSQPGPELLPFHDRSWPDFERIVLVIAEYIDGIRGVRLYGAPGQEQRGIDLWGFDHEGVNVGYQPKRLKSFDERDLAEAVGKFDGEHRAVNAKRLIICVACDADRTQISEALDEQRRAHPDFEIDLYDRRRLSEKLKSRPDLVRRLFGADWAAAFCDNVDWPVPIPTATDVLADALIRGPIMALGLEQDFANCNALALSDPKRAAADLGSIIEALTVGNFAAFAAPLQLQQAELLVASGNTAAAIDILSELAWDRIEAGGNNWDQQSLGRIRALLADGDSSHGAAFVNFVDGINQWYGQPHIDVSALLPQHETFASTEHRLSDLATLWILETAVATGELDAAIALRDRSRAAVIAREPKGLSDPTTVRLRTATADADG